MNPKTLHTMQLLFSAFVLICLYISQNFPQYAPLANDVAGFLATATAALAGHAMPTEPQAIALQTVAMSSRPIPSPAVLAAALATVAASASLPHSLPPSPPSPPGAV